jgi:hypothetical protein
MVLQSVIAGVIALVVIISSISSLMPGQTLPCFGDPAQYEDCWSLKFISSGNKNTNPPLIAHTVYVYHTLGIISQSTTPHSHFWILQILLSYAQGCINAPEIFSYFDMVPVMPYGYEKFQFR